MVSFWGVYGLTSRFSTAPVAAIFGWKSKWRARCHFPGCQKVLTISVLHYFTWPLIFDLHLYHSTSTFYNDKIFRPKWSKKCLNARHIPYILDLSNISHSAWSLNLAHMRTVGSQPLKNLPVHRSKSDAQQGRIPRWWSKPAAAVGAQLVSQLVGWSNDKAMIKWWFIIGLLYWFIIPMFINQYNKPIINHPKFWLIGLPHTTRKTTS